MADRNNSQANEKRQTLKRSILVGGALVMLPVSWKKPVVQTFVLPAHALTSTVFAVASAQEAAPGMPCSGPAIGINISGTVTASDGSDLAGVSLTIEYTNAPDKGMGKGGLQATLTTIVLAGNTFSTAGLTALPPAGDFWDGPDGRIVVRFTDQVTYGASFLVVDVTCIGA